MMLLANSAVISEAAESPAWKRALEPNSWQFGDLWSAFPEFANSIVLWRHPSSRARTAQNLPNRDTSRACFP